MMCCRNINLVLALAGILFLSFSAPAAERAAEKSEIYTNKYKVGTMGYLYGDCAYALEHSTSPREFYNTYCGSFIEGYGMGIFISGFAAGGVNPKDPCHLEKMEEYTKINQRLCRYLPNYLNPAVKPGMLIQTLANIVFRWQAQIKKNGHMSVFQKPVTEEINSIITPGKFCESLNVYEVIQEPGFVINPGLINANWMQFIESGAITLEDKYRQCKADLQEENFNDTRCGAEIIGFISGLYSTQHLQNRKPVEGPCAKAINRLYENLDMPRKLCVDEKTTRPMDVAQIFVRKIESMKKYNQGTYTLGYGGIGYQAIYYGLLCKKSDLLTPMPPDSEN